MLCLYRCINVPENMGNSWNSDMFLNKISVLKIEAHTKRTEPEYQGNVLADFHVKATSTKSIKIVAQADEVHSASAKMTPRCLTLITL